MEEKKYLKWYNKVGYGSGDLAANCIYGLVTSFVMIYLTDTVGLNSGVIGVLIAVARVFDGISDVIFGNLMDKTHTKMVKPVPGCCGRRSVTVSAWCYCFPCLWEWGRQHSTHTSSSYTFC